MSVIYTEEYCIFCDSIAYEREYYCHRCEAHFCADCYDNEDLVEQTSSPDFCEDLIACDERRLNLLIKDPSHYRNCRDEANIMDYIMIMTKCSWDNANVAINITGWDIRAAVAMLK